MRPGLSVQRFEVWYGAQVIGPVSLDQIRRGLEAGKIPEDAQARLVGTEPWHPVREVIRRPDEAQPIEIRGEVLHLPRPRPNANLVAAPPIKPDEPARASTPLSEGGAEWTVRLDGGWLAADREAILVEWIRQGRVGPHTPIRHASWATPQPLGKVGRFQHVFAVQVRDPSLRPAAQHVPGPPSQPFVGDKRLVVTERDEARAVRGGETDAEARGRVAPTRGLDAWRADQGEQTLGKGGMRVLAVSPATPGNAPVDQIAPSAGKASPAPGTPEPARTSPMLSRRWKLLLAVVLSTTIVAVGGGLVLRRYIASGQRALPIVAARLPPRTLRVSDSRLRADLDELAVLPDAYVTSALAAVACGGTDVALLIERARGRDLGWLKRNGIFDLGHDEHIRDALTCGAAIRLGGNKGSPSRVGVTFMQDEKPMDVVVLRSPLTDLSLGPGFMRHNFSGLSGQCRHPDEAKTDCPDGATATLHDGDTWVFGDVVEVEAFGRTYTSAHEELTTSVEILQGMVAHTRGADETVIIAKPETVPWKEVCERAAPINHEKEFVAACFPSGQEKVMEAIATRTRGLAIERDMLAKGIAFSLNYVLLARDDDDARELEKDLRDFVRDWRAHVANHEPEMIRLIRAPSDYVHDRFWEAGLDPLLRALHAIDVTRNGAVVRLVIRQELRPEEAKSLKEFVATRRATQDALGAIVDALVQHTPLPEKKLSMFVGPDVAAWMSAPRASIKDCTTIGAKLKSVTAGDLSPEQAGMKLVLDHRYAQERCVGMSLPAETKTCLDHATSMQEFASCKIMLSPLAAAALRRLDGQWLRVRRPVEPAVRLEFGGGRVALAIEDASVECESDVESDDLDSASFGLVLHDGLVRQAVTFEKDGTLKLSFKPKAAASPIEMMFKAAKFDKPLLKPAPAAAPTPPPAAATADPVAPQAGSGKNGPVGTTVAPAAPKPTPSPRPATPAPIHDPGF